MISKIDKKYKIELGKGTIYLTRGRMGAVLIERKLNIWIDGRNYEDLGMALVYPWEGYQGYTDDELIQEIQECFWNPQDIKELLRTQDKRLKKVNAEMKKEGKRLLEEIKKDSLKVTV